MCSKSTITVELDKRAGEIVQSIFALMQLEGKTTSADEIVSEVVREVLSPKLDELIRRRFLPKDSAIVDALRTGT